MFKDLTPSALSCPSCEMREHLVYSLLFWAHRLPSLRYLCAVYPSLGRHLLGAWLSACVLTWRRLHSQALSRHCSQTRAQQEVMLEVSLSRVTQATCPRSQRRVTPQGLLSHGGPFPS